MININFALVGAGGFGREVMPYVKESLSHTLGVEQDKIGICFVETFEPKTNVINGYPLMSLKEFSHAKGTKYFNVAVGDPKLREKLVAELIDFATPVEVIAPDVQILDSNNFGKGIMLCPRTTITSNSIIGDYFQCNLYSYVAHDCVIGSYVTFAPGVRCNGNVHIDDYSYIGTNAIIREGTSSKPIRIGRNSIIGMGAVVTKDVPDYSVVVGNPAKLLKKLEIN